MIVSYLVEELTLESMIKLAKQAISIKGTQSDDSDNDSA